ncbi:aspartate aminotransferase family protein [Paraburkholderia sp. EG285A]|uniref:aspartate aminotransferase family protein n=1 Tax=Paraburkholderia sp. EG285A TaxID=3237009 RepID=UPI0034D33E48
MTDVTDKIFIDFMQMRSFSKNPLIFTRGEGIYLIDDKGRRYVDGLSGIFVNSIGHGNAAVIEAMTQQLHRVAFTPPLLGTNDAALRLTKQLLEIGPPGVSAVKLLSTGAEATEAAMKLARQYFKQTGKPGKYKILSHYGSYHGATLGALAASGGKDRKSIFEPLGGGFIHFHPPFLRRWDSSLVQDETVFVELINRTIEAEDPDTIAAVIVEPICVNSSGFMVPPQNYLRRLKDVCEKHNILLILDEIITGFGRVGTMFASEHFGVVPDMTCCAKGMSSGYAALSAVLINETVAGAFYGDEEDLVQFRSSGTFGGNPVSAAAGEAVISELLRKGIVENSRTVGAHLRSRLEELASEFSVITDVRGVGLLQGVEYSRGRVGSAIAKEAIARGLLLRVSDDFTVFAPPLIITKEEIDDTVELFRDVLRTVSK